MRKKSELKLSPEFDVNDPPKMVGIYKVRSPSFDKLDCWSYFNGAIFNGVWLTHSTAELNKYFGRGCFVSKWQGILK